MKKKESTEEKKITVTVTFYKENASHGYRHPEQLELPPFEGTDETKEMTILKALSDLNGFDERYDYIEELKKIDKKIGLSEATISKFAKEAKSLKAFRLLVHKELVERNIRSLGEFYEERDGEPGITIKEVLESGDWMYLYGCEFDIQESTTEELRIEKFIDTCKKKLVEERLKTKESLLKRQSEILAEVGKTDNPIQLEKLSIEYRDLIKKLEG